MPWVATRPSDDFGGGGALLSEGIAALNPWLLARTSLAELKVPSLRFPVLRTHPMANDDIDRDSCFARTVAGRPSLHSTASAHGVRAFRPSYRPDGRPEDGSRQRNK